MSSYPQQIRKQQSDEVIRKTSQTVTQTQPKKSKRSIPLFPLKRFVLRRSDPEKEFQRISPLGIGSFGTVYKSRSVENGKLYAVKTIKEDERHKEEKLATEIGFLNHCSSDFVSTFIDAFFFENKLTIVLEFFESGSIHDVMKMAKVKMPENFILEVVAQTLLALAFLQTKRVLHRDIKCGNLLLTSEGQTKLCDFGVSRLFNLNETYTKTIIGTPFWMAPEIVSQSGYSYNADIWSLGISMIEMKDGSPPLTHLSAIRAMYVAQRRAPPTFRRPARVSKQLKAFLPKLLVKEKKLRPEAATMLQEPDLVPIVQQLERATPKYSSVIVKKMVQTNLEKVIEFRSKTKFHEGDSEAEESEKEEEDGSVMFIGRNVNKGKLKNESRQEQESLIQLGNAGDKLRGLGDNESENSENDVESLVQVDNPTIDSDIESLVFLAIEPVDEEFSDNGTVVVEGNDDDEDLKMEGLPEENKRISRRKITLKDVGFKSSFMMRRSRVKYSPEVEVSDPKVLAKKSREAGTKLFDPNLKEMMHLHSQVMKFKEQKNTDIRIAVSKYHKQCSDVDTGVGFKAV